LAEHPVLEAYTTAEPV